MTVTCYWSSTYYTIVSFPTASISTSSKLLGAQLPPLPLLTPAHTVLEFIQCTQWVYSLYTQIGLDSRKLHN